MIMLKYFTTPFICALIGWVTNRIAIRMLFHPKRPIQILSWTWQGIFPKRQSELAQSLGQLVEEELINHQDIKEVINDPEFIQKLKKRVENYLENFIEEKLTSLNPLLANILKGSVLEKIKETIVQEVELLIPDIMEQATNELESRLKFSRIVQEKIESFSMDKLEQVIFTIMKREFRFVEVIGGVLGLIIGIVQSTILFLA